ncbi:CPBP family intramembrane metalloprotease [Paenisporosarcina cavernae]|uniref:CPBP family intramembrane metalloprotease n=2 Tax=Paenisporosarcina cavernae TaxID=2320858 RepID=A0A385YY26_9BACL|nr:CPBP family intramembrane metalloprotease [Paenisporosarcina cavernae]
MQLSGFLIGPLLFLYFQGVYPNDLKMAELMTNGWFVFVSMSLAAVIFLFLIRKEKNFVDLPGKKASIGKSIGFGIIGFFLVLIGQSIGAYIESLIGIPPGSENTAQFLEIASAAPVAIFSIVLFAPFLEEVVFRRVIFGTVLGKSNFVIAAIVSAVVFAIIHFDFAHIILYAISGFIFAYLYYITKRLLTSFIAHMLLNGFVTVIQLNIDALEKFQKSLQFILHHLQ